MLADIRQPWRAFLTDIDAVLVFDKVAGPVQLHCVGGFVVATCYDLQRSTADLDVFEVVPAAALKPLLQLAGKGSQLAYKHGVYVDAGSRVAMVPEGYADRLTELSPDTFVNLKLFALDPYDLALSQLERNIDRDREDVLLLAQTTVFDVAELRERYMTELRPIITGPVSRHDLTLELWIEMINEVRRR